MAFISVTCPICGAKIPSAGSAQDFTCSFCKFERRPAVEPRVESGSKLEVNQISESHIDGILWDMTLPFQKDINNYFREKFQQLKPGGLLYLSTPVKRPFHKAAALPGQINFFKAKNIMFLLEQHGFKMAWRQNRFASTLRIIARRC